MSTLKQLCILAMDIYHTDLSPLPTTIIKEIIPEGYIEHRNMTNEHISDYIKDKLREQIDYIRSEMGYVRTLFLRFDFERYGEYTYHLGGYFEEYTNIEVSPNRIDIFAPFGTYEAVFNEDFMLYSCAYSEETGLDTVKIIGGYTKVILDDGYINCIELRSDSDIKDYLPIDDLEKCVMIVYGPNSTLDAPIGIFYDINEDYMVLHDSYTECKYLFDIDFRCIGVKINGKSIERCNYTEFKMEEHSGAGYERFIDTLNGR